MIPSDPARTPLAAKAHGREVPRENLRWGRHCAPAAAHLETTIIFHKLILGGVRTSIYIYISVTEYCLSIYIYGIYTLLYIPLYTPYSVTPKGILQSTANSVANRILTHARASPSLLPSHHHLPGMWAQVCKL